MHFIFREFSRNPLDVAAFVLARCDGDDKTLATIELLFAEQDKWAFVDNPLEALIAALRPTGMSHDQAMACLKDQSKADAMTKIVNAAVQRRRRCRARRPSSSTARSTTASCRWPISTRS